jgi:CHAT domain-containing protein
VDGKGVPKQCLSDFAVSSYIPTIHTLFKTPTPVKKSDDSASTGLLIVSQPNTPGQSAIPYVDREVETIQKQLEKRKIPSVILENGTVNDFLKSMESSPSIHLACHAAQNVTKPLKSSIYLHDGPLELIDIMKKNLTHSDFAFLSACQTSKGVENLPEEVVHLASGMLAAGYRSVVGTMWSIFDTHGPDMAEFFYESLLVDTTNGEPPKVDGIRAARALHRATRRLQEKLPRSPESLLAWVPYIHIGI